MVPPDSCSPAASVTCLQKFRARLLLNSASGRRMASAHGGQADSVMEHIRSINPDEEWERGARFWLRRRGLALAGGLDLILTILSHFLLGWQVASALLAAGVLIFASLVFLRKVRVRDYSLGVSLHGLFHEMRDEAEKVILPLSEENDPNVGMARYRERYGAFHNGIAERTAIFFRCLLRDQTVNCAIRLADLHQGERVYVTWGRSRNMDPTRAERTVPVPSEGSIAAALLRHEERGVYYVPNVREVTEEDKKDKWHDDPNTQLNDLTALMVAPINAYGGGRKFMLGLLYVTSRESRLCSMCAEPLKAIADALGFVYPRITVGTPKREREHGQEGASTRDIR